MEPLMVKLVMDGKLHEAWSALPDSPVVPDPGPSRLARLWSRVPGLVQGARLSAATALRRTADRVDPCPCRAPGRPA
jgi:hypothetical protein